jgi:hypothetical protein
MAFWVAMRQRLSYIIEKYRSSSKVGKAVKLARYQIKANPEIVVSIKV